MTAEQRAAMTPAQKKGIADIKLKLKAAEADKKAAEAERVKQEATRDKLKDKSDAIGLKASQRKAKLDEANKSLNDTKRGVADKKMLTDAMTNGVLAPDAPNPMSDADAAAIANAYTVGFDFGSSALNLVRTTDDRANIVDGVTRLTKGAQNKFRDGAGNAYGDSKARGDYAANALKTGANVGGDYFKNMDTYIKTGGLRKPAPIPMPSPATWKTIAAARSKHLGGAMMGPGGQIEAQSVKAKTAVADISFHPSVLQNTQPELIKHANEMSASMAKPGNKAKCQAALDGITTAPTSVIAKGLVAKDSGKAAGDLNKGDVKQAVMTAMFTPLKQGPVGSCFATGPARAKRATDPGGVMEDIAQIAVKGTFTPNGSTVPMKAVRNSTDPKLNKLPLGDNQLMRSWEYSIATAAAQTANARESKKLKKTMFADPKSMAAIAKLYPRGKWPEVRTKLEAAVKTKLTFRYNSTSVIKGSSDGSSTKGNFEIIDKTASGDASMLTTKEKFIAAITKIALAAIPEGKDTDIGKKIIAHCKSDPFINAICPGDYKPWELSGGGFDDAAIQVLEGGNQSYSSLTPNQTQTLTDGPRTAQVAIGVIKSFDAATAGGDMSNLTVNGIHTFNGLPNDPSLDKLKGGDTAAKLDEHLLKPGQKIAATKLKLGKAAMIFEKQIHEAEGWGMGEDGAALIKVALALKPSTETTPKELKSLVETAMGPLKKLMSKQRVDKWKTEQTDAGTTITEADIANQKETWDTAGDTAVTNSYDNEIIVQTAPPQFTIADTNWGDEKKHVFFVIIADPISGEPKLFKKEQPSGELTAMDPKWIQARWKEVK